MQINGIEVEDTFAEAFDMTGTRIIITAAEPTWARRAAEAMTGFATSVIGCGVEAGIERFLESEETPDGRPGVAILLFSVSGSELEKQLVRRVGQCVLTCPSTSVFAGLYSEKRIAMGSQLRYFGDGHQISKKIGKERYWRIPVMDGEFVCQDTSMPSRCRRRWEFFGAGRDDPRCPSCLRLRCQCDQTIARLHHSVSGWRRSKRFESRFQVQNAKRVYQRRFLSNAARADQIPCTRRYRAPHWSS